MSSSSTDTRKSRSPLSRVTVLVLAICWFTVVSDGYDVVIYGAVVPSLLAEPGWQLTPASAGVIGSLALLGMFIGSLVVGTLTDVIGRRRTLIWCLAWFSAFTALCALVDSPALFGALRFVAGLGLGGVLPTATALTAEYSPRKVRNFVYALMFSGFPVGGILAALLGLGLIPTFGWRAMFVVGAVPLVVAVPLALRYLPESIAFLLAKGRIADAEAVARRHGLPLPTAEEAPATDSPAARSTPLRDLFSPAYLVTTVCFLVSTFVCLFMIYGLNTWLPQIMRQAGYSLGGALTFLLAFNVGAILGTILVSRIADRLGSKPIVIATFLIASVAIALMSLRLPTGFLLVLIGLGGLGTIGTQSFIIAYVSQHFPVRMSATAIGWTLGFGRLGSVAAPPVLGLILGAGVALEWNFYAIAVAGLIGALLIPLIPRTPIDG